MATWLSGVTEGGGGHTLGRSASGCPRRLAAAPTMLVSIGPRPRYRVSLLFGFGRAQHGHSGCRKLLDVFARSLIIISSKFFIGIQTSKIFLSFSTWFSTTLHFTGRSASSPSHAGGPHRFTAPVPSPPPASSHVDRPNRSQPLFLISNLFLLSSSHAQHFSTLFLVLIINLPRFSATLK